MTNGRIHRKLREHSSSNYAINCLGEQREGEGEKKKTDEDDVCLSKRRGQTLKQQKLKAKGTCSHLASCSLAECGAMAFTRSQ